MKTVALCISLKNNKTVFFYCSRSPGYQEDSSVEMAIDKYLFFPGKTLFFPPPFFYFTKSDIFEDKFQAFETKKYNNCTELPSLRDSHRSSLRKRIVFRGYSKKKTKKVVFRNDRCFKLKTISIENHNY